MFASVPLIPKFASEVPQGFANFGIGTLVPPSTRRQSALPPPRSERNSPHAAKGPVWPHVPVLRGRYRRRKPHGRPHSTAGARNRPRWQRDVRWVYRNLGNADAKPPSELAKRLLALAREHPDRFVACLAKLETPTPEPDQEPEGAKGDRPAGRCPCDGETRRRISSNGGKRTLMMRA